MKVCLQYYTSLCHNICHLTTMHVPICYPLTAWVSAPGSFGNFGNDVHVACWDLPGANLGRKTSCKWGYISTPTSRVKEPQEIPPIFEPFYWGSNITPFFRSARGGGPRVLYFHTLLSLSVRIVLNISWVQPLAGSQHS